MLNPRNPRTPRSGHDHVPTHVPAPCRFCLTTDNRHAQKGTPSPVPHGKNLTQLFTMGRVQPRSLGNRGGTWYFLASSSPYTHGIGASRNLFAPDCTGIGMFQGPAYLPHAPESVRHATVLQREWCIACPELPLPLSRERYAMQPIESSESVATV